MPRIMIQLLWTVIVIFSVILILGNILKNVKSKLPINESNKNNTKTDNEDTIYEVFWILIFWLIFLNAICLGFILCYSSYWRATFSNWFRNFSYRLTHCHRRPHAEPDVIFDANALPDLVHM